MNENLLDRVSVEKLDMLVDALGEVIKEMKSTGGTSDACFRDESYWTCFSVRNMIFASLRRHAMKSGSSKL
ncbi:MAG: S-adenosylmethionine synthetase [Prevotellaceae bacterium]|jgi:hypothetical protein|nr:S-adenosylmethionine synthetase [Prevotellaceae bacterium]